MQEKQEIAKGVYYTNITETTFKTARVSVNMILPLNKRTVSTNAVLPYLLCRGEDFTTTNRKLDELFGAKLFSGVEKLGEYLMVTVGIEIIKKRFAPEGRNPVLEAARFISDLVLKPSIYNGVFRNADVESEKQNVLGLLAAEQNDKRTFARNRCLSFVMGNRPYGLNKYGDAESLTAITPRAMYRCWENALKTAQIEIITIGDENAVEISKAFSDFTSIARTPISYEAPAPVKKCKQSGEIVERMDITQAKLVIGYATEIMLPKQTAAFELMNCLFGMTPTSMLFANVRERMSLCYYCISRYLRVNGLLIVESGIEEKNAEAAKAEIQNQLNLIAKGEFSESALSDSKLYLQNLYQSIMGSLATLERHWVTEIVTGTLLSPAQKADLLKEITAADIQQMAASCWLDTSYMLAGKQLASVEETK